MVYKLGCGIAVLRFSLVVVCRKRLAVFFWSTLIRCSVRLFCHPTRVVFVGVSETKNDKWHHGIEAHRQSMVNGRTLQQTNLGTRNCRTCTSRNWSISFLVPSQRTICMTGHFKLRDHLAQSTNLVYLTSNASSQPSIPLNHPRLHSRPRYSTQTSTVTARYAWACSKQMNGNPAPR